MGDSGEGLIDAEARIQERMDELARARSERRAEAVRDPDAIRELESLRLARTALQRQFDESTHERRRAQLTQAMSELDARIGALETRVKSS
jgi:hypothetical protein